MYLAVSLTWACFQLLLTCFATKLVERENVVAQGSLCYMDYPDAVILEDKLYFMGGSYTFEGGDTNALEDKMYWLDLNISFPLDVTISPNVLQSMTAPGDDWRGVGAMFTDPLMTTFYHFDGYAAPNNSTVPSFNATTQTWENASVSGGSFNTVDRGEALWATTSTSGLGLSFITGGSEKDVPPGMIVFDASDPNNLTWTNKTHGTPHLDLGTMQYARFGNKGVLIAFGGYTDLYTASLYDMSLIHVYDIDSDTWFNVTATGDVPLDRSDFCSVISASPDDSSFQITFYGGYNIHEGAAFQDVYVLAIPAFRYINITSTNNVETQLGAGDGHYQTTCALYEDRQMMILGGLIILGGENHVVNTDTCNSSWGAIRQLDTTTFEWQDAFSPGSEPYAVPDQVSNVIGGGPSGSATLVSPAGGFNDSALGPIFKKTIPRVTINSTSTSASTSASTSPTAKSKGGQGSASNLQSSSSSPSTGAIAGGVVGGVVIIAIVSALVYVFCYRRRKRNRLQRKGTTGEWKKSELSSHPSVLGRSRYDYVHEMHGDHKPSEIDSNALVEGPSGIATTAPVLYEMSASR